jgi:hypothetical protein
MMAVVKGFLFTKRLLPWFVIRPLILFTASLPLNPARVLRMLDGSARLGV